MPRTILHRVLPPLALLLAAATTGCGGGGGGGGSLFAGSASTKTLTDGDGKVEVTPLSLSRAGSRVEVTLRIRNAAQQVSYIDPTVRTLLDVGAPRPVSGTSSHCASGPGFPLASHFGPGDTIVGCVGFALPRGTSPKTLLYGMNRRSTGLTWKAGSIPALAAAGAPAPAPTDAGRPGTPATVTGRDYGVEPEVGVNNPYLDTRLQVTVEEIADPAPIDRFETPDPGYRPVAVRLTLRNTGAHPYYALPDDKLLLWDRDNHVYEGDVAVTTSIGPMFRGQVIPPGGSATGWISYQLPQHAALNGLEYLLEEGGAGAAARWQPR